MLTSTSLCDDDNDESIEVHAGFAAMLERLYGDILDDAREGAARYGGAEALRNAQWAVFGHSLGGALAALFCIRMAFEPNAHYASVAAFPFCPAASLALQPAASDTLYHTLARKSVSITNIIVGRDIVSSERHFRHVGCRNTVQPKWWTLPRVLPIPFAHFSNGRAVRNFPENCLSATFWK